MPPRESSGEGPISWRHWLGWGFFAAGWAVWLVAICLPGWDIVVLLGFSPTGPGLPIAVWLLLAPLMVVDKLQRMHLTEALLLALCTIPYFVAALTAARGAFRNRRGLRGFRWPSRLLGLGLLEAWLYTGLLFPHQLPEMPPGFIVLAVGSTLICLGVWIIPPRQKHKDIPGSGPVVPQVGPPSGM
jgi:hypothetical protein